ncbi:uncharacterized protein MYCFIDRAFT_177978 [Pseudocercospora fijiensis CIRAD86]|uniref:Uncharacterized protein n=1 Tax=Pseudocercospora fijiensis (strain CIRAD86) TaxID=383855 RepID=M3APL2_PSEFD|nr:uncharacterized protein MYCFIDRAFT_177978 [Pseudocercospora fijiensis CIRAD86]EME79377.1 hypothetical protein MYCFIDRAFT_177978 [Pseudocercospora fijiensis CIRAD86]
MIGEIRSWLILKVIRTPAQGIASSPRSEASSYYGVASGRHILVFPGNHSAGICPRRRITVFTKSDASFQGCWSPAGT